jgi:predicted SprT family Zn-dependent metalloprotease
VHTDAKSAQSARSVNALAYTVGQNSGDHDQEDKAENITVRAAKPGISWDFSKIPLFAPDRASRPQPSSPVAATPRPGTIQTKLVVGPINDPLEHEADRVADRVMRIPASSVSLSATPTRLSRKCAACEEEGQVLQTKGAGSPLTATSEAPDVVHDVLRSPGQPLDPGIRTFFEPRFGHDLSAVRVHTDAKSAQSARSVNALAYTVGHDIVFDTGQYTPTASESRRLIAHELAHVVQQTGVSNPALGVRPSDSDTVRRYSHRDCADADLSSHIWPADAEARKMTANAIAALSASPIPASATPLFTKYFMTATPDTAKILSVYQKVQSKFTANDYTYECEDDCTGTELGYVYGLWSHIHLCMNHIRSWSDSCIGRTMVHEFTHYYAGTEDKGYCKSDCSFAACPSSLTISDALQNADSFACFAYELYLTPPAPAPAPTPPAPTPAPSPSTVPRTYTVVEGDYLIKIATDLCGDGSKWEDIYAANRAIIGADPDVIFPGQVLTIPCPPP